MQTSPSPTAAVEHSKGLTIPLAGYFKAGHRPKNK